MTAAQTTVAVKPEWFWWDQKFGPVDLVDAEKFTMALQQSFPQVADSLIRQLVLSLIAFQPPNDPSYYVSKDSFARFLALFGPFQESVYRAVDTLFEPGGKLYRWFHGVLSSKQVSDMFHRHPDRQRQFLVRVSASVPNQFQLHWSQPNSMTGKIDYFSLSVLPVNNQFKLNTKPPQTFQTLVDAVHRIVGDASTPIRLHAEASVFDLSPHENMWKRYTFVPIDVEAAKAAALAKKLQDARQCWSGFKTMLEQVSQIVVRGQALVDSAEKEKEPECPTTVQLIMVDRTVKDGLDRLQGYINTLAMPMLSKAGGHLYDYSVSPSNSASSSVTSPSPSRDAGKGRSVQRKASKARRYHAHRRRYAPRRSRRSHQRRAGSEDSASV